MSNIKLYEIKNLVESEIKLDLKTKNRQRRYVIGRFIYGKLARDYTSETLMDIALQIERDHTSIVHYLKTFDSFYRFDNNFRKIYDKLEEQLQQIVKIKSTRTYINKKVIHPYRLINAKKSLRKILIQRR